MTSTKCDVAFTFTNVSIVVPVLGCHILHVKGRDNQASRGRAGNVGPSAKVAPCYSSPGMQCSQNNGSSIYKPFRGHTLTSYWFLWRVSFFGKTVS